MLNSLEIKFVPKGWGFEKWIVNCEEYCGKLLYFVKGKRCSWHYHKLKDEVFYIQSGKILVKYSDEDDIENAKELTNLYAIQAALFAELTEMRGIKLDATGGLAGGATVN